VREGVPVLARVARKYLAIAGASAATEKMFSYCGLHVSQNHTSLDGETILSMMRVRCLSRFVEKWGAKYLN
jgi:hypothetical protein